MLLYADGKLIPIDYTFCKKGKLGYHDWGILRDNKTHKEIGSTLHIFTRDYADSFTINRKDLLFVSKPDKITRSYAYFQSTKDEGKELIMPMERVKIVIEKTVDRGNPEYIRISWRELTGEEFDYSNSPF
jgi:hypothetical protein